MFRTIYGLNDLGYIVTFYETIEDEPQEPKPALPYEVFQTEPPDPQRAWAAVVEFCRGN